MQKRSKVCIFFGHISKTRAADLQLAKLAYTTAAFSIYL